jgi:hypothetical protein
VWDWSLFNSQFYSVLSIPYTHYYADHPPPFSAKVKMSRSYTSLPPEHSWHIVGQLLLLYFVISWDWILLSVAFFVLFSHLCITLPNYSHTFIICILFVQFIVFLYACPSFVHGHFLLINCFLHFLVCFN